VASQWDVIIVGAGASGCFTAIRIKEARPDLRVMILERQGQALQKVRISGGGRCNVTHNSDDPVYLLKHYPRKHGKLKGLLKTFGPRHMRDWLREQGVPTHAEPDGRVFPSSNRSESVMEAFLNRLRDLQITVHYRFAVEKIIYVPDKGFMIQGAPDQPDFETESLVLATGGHEQGVLLADSLGLALVERAPSLFTFQVQDDDWPSLAGLACEQVALKLKPTGSDQTFAQAGSLLFTHWGFSGPAILKLSAQAALALQHSGYCGMLYINSLPWLTQETTRQHLMNIRQEQARKALKNVKPDEGIPWRYWHWILQRAEMNPDQTCGETAEKTINQLVEALHHLPIQIDGKGQFKEEFVTAGGVDTKALTLDNLQARGTAGLFVVGELLNVDGMTGGFNFQHCWACADAVARSFVQNPKHLAQ
jgi:predicted Rossmann fold flavoprotein